MSTVMKSGNLAVYTKGSKSYLVNTGQDGISCTDAPSATFKDRLGDVASLLFSSQGTTITSISRNGTATVFGGAFNSILETYVVKKNNLGHVEFQKCGFTLTELVESSLGLLSPDGSLFAIVVKPTTIYLFSFHSGKHLVTLNGHVNDIVSLAFSKDGTILASKSNDSIIKLWRVTTGECFQTIQVQELKLQSVQPVNDGSGDGRSKSNQTASSSSFGGHPAPEFDFGTRGGSSLFGTTAGAGLFSAKPVSSFNQTAPSSSFGGQPTASFGTTAGAGLFSAKPVSSFNQTAPSSSGSFGTRGGSPLFRAKSAAKPNQKALSSSFGGQPVESSGINLHSISISPDGKIVACGSVNGVTLFETDTGAEMKRLNAGQSTVSAVSFSYDSKLVAAAYGNMIKVWQVETGDCTNTLSGNLSAVTSIAFSTMGNSIVSGFTDGKIGIWNLSDEFGCHSKIFAAHQADVTCVAFSQDGNSIGSGSKDCTIKIWPVFDGQFLREITLCEFTKDLKYVAISSGSNVEIYDSTTAKVFWSKSVSCSKIELAPQYPYKMRLTYADGSYHHILWLNPIVQALAADNVVEMMQWYHHIDMLPKDPLLTLCVKHKAVKCGKYLVGSRPINQRGILQALHESIAANKHEFLFLVPYVRDLQQCDASGKTLLHLAGAANSKEFCNALLEAGADVTVGDDNGHLSADFASSDGVKQLLQKAGNMIMNARNKSNIFDWAKEFQALVTVAKKWRDSLTDDTILHLVVKSKHYEAIKCIAEHCPEFLMEKTSDGRSLFQGILPLSSELASVIFGAVIKQNNRSLFETLSKDYRESMLLCKSPDGRLIYEELDESLIDVFAEYHVEGVLHAEEIVKEVEEVLEEVRSSVPSKHNSVCMKIALVLKEKEQVNLSVPSIMSAAQTQELKEAEDSLAMQLRSPDVTIEEAEIAVKQRNSLLLKVVPVLEDDIRRYSEAIDNVKAVIMELESTEEALAKLSETLPDFKGKPNDVFETLSEVVNSNHAKAISESYEKLEKIQSMLYSPKSGDLKFSKAVILELVQVLPKCFKEMEDFQEVCSAFITVKLARISKRLMELREKAVGLERKKNVLENEYYTPLKHQANVATDFIDVKPKYEMFSEEIFTIKKDINEQLFRIKNRVRTGSANDMLGELQSRLKELKKNPEFTSLRNKLRQWSSVLPEVSFWFPELDPLEDLEASSRYPAADIEADYTVERQLTSRVVVAKKEDSSLCVLKKFLLSSERSMLKHAVAIHSKFDLHPNILKLNAIANDSSTEFIFLEYPFYPLGDMVQWRRSEAYKPEFVGKLFFDTVKGLQALHGRTESARILHRDIKPQNILVDDTNGQLKAVLADFDLSEFHTPQAEITIHTTSRVPLTQDFVAPELLFLSSGRKHSVYSDLFSLGVTIGYILLGCPNNVVRKAEEIMPSDELTDDQKALICGLIKSKPEDRMPLTDVLKNPFIKGDCVCRICFDTKMVQEVMLCMPEKKHAVCFECFGAHVKLLVDKPVGYLEKTRGAVVCFAEGCTCQFSFSDICEKTSSEVVAAYFEAQTKLAEAVARRTERKTFMKQTEAERLREKQLNQKLREAIIEGRQSSKKEMLGYLLTEKAMEMDEYRRYPVVPA